MQKRIKYNKNIEIISAVDEDKSLDKFISKYFDLNLLQDFRKIYVLVSGGIDSTLLYHIIKKKFDDRVYPVNCFNPYENNKTLKKIAEMDKNYIQIKPDEEYNYSEILKNAFKNLNLAAELRENKKYHKKVFGCCYFIKHRAFLNDPLFKEDNTVVVSGIKAGDGSQRQAFLSQLRNGRPKINRSTNKNNLKFAQKLIKPSKLLLKFNNEIFCEPN